jgi:hypothetical protein
VGCYARGIANGSTRETRDGGHIVHYYGDALVFLIRLLPFSSSGT